MIILFLSFSCLTVFLSVYLFVWMSKYIFILYFVCLSFSSFVNYFYGQFVLVFLGGRWISFYLKLVKSIVTNTDPDQGIIMYDHRMPLLALKIENRTLPALAICRMLGVWSYKNVDVAKTGSNPFLFTDE